MGTQSVSAGQRSEESMDASAELERHHDAVEDINMQDLHARVRKTLLL